jgi:hypothetical protein
MNRTRPTLKALGARVRKERDREIGNWLARRAARPMAVYGTWLAVRIGLSAHQVTLLAVLAALASACSIAAGERWLFVAGVGLAHLAYWLDHVDGQVARWRGTASLDGVYFDYLMHHGANQALGFALGYGLAARTGETRWTIAGFAIAAGWTLLGLHNDCRYKAFFQRLKSARGSHKVDAGWGGRPQPPAPWPRAGLGAMTWPAYKSCEIHIVLMSATGLAFLAALAPLLWEALLRAWVCYLAVMAPSLAIARAARSVMRGSVEAEFARWFRPLEVTECEAANEPAPACAEGLDGACGATGEAGPPTLALNPSIYGT